MEFLPFFPKYFLIAMCMFFVFYTLGHIVAIFLLQKKSLEQNIAVSTFYKLFFGTIISVCLYAIIKTAGNSQMLPLLFATLIFLVFKKHTYSLADFSKTFIIPTKHILYILIILFISMLFFSLRLGTHELNIASIHHDIIFRGGIIDYLVLYGKEELVARSIIPELTNQITIYHYFELWLSGIYAQFFNISGTNAYYMLSIPTLLTIVVYGVYSFMISCIKTFPILLAICAIGIMFFSGFSALEMFFNSTLGIHVGRMYPLAEKSEKLIIIYAAFIFLLHQLRVRNKTYSYIAISILGIIYSSTILIPVVCLAFLLFLKDLIHYKCKKGTLYSFISFSPLLILILYFLFIFISKDSGQQHINTNMFVFSFFSFITQCFTILKNIIIDFLFTIIITIIFYITSHKKVKKLIKNIIFIPLSLCFIACIISPLFQPVSIEWFQVKDNIVYPILSTLQIVIFALIIFSKSQWYLKTISIIGIAVQLIINKPFIPYEKPIPSSVAENYRNIFNPTLPVQSVFYKSYDSVSTNQWSNRFDLRIPFKNLRRISNNYYPICMNVSDYPENYRDKSVYYVWAKQNQKDIYSLNSQIEFIKFYKPNFIFIENSYKTNVLTYLPKATLVYFDTRENYFVYSIHW